MIPSFSTMASAETPCCRRIDSSIWCSLAQSPAFTIRENRSSCCSSSQTLVVHCSARRRSRRLILRSFSSSSFSLSFINPLSGNGRVVTMGVGRRGGPITAAEDEEQEGKGDALEPEEGDPKDIAGGREDAGELQKGSRGIVSSIEEALPTKDLVTLASCVVGLLTGVGVVLFNQIVHKIRDFSWDGIPSRGASWLREEPVEAVWLRVILVPACGGVIVGMLNSLRAYLEDPSEGNGTSDVRGALGSFVKAIAASVTLGTGNSLGPEGPSVEIGSSIAKGVSNIFKWNGGKSLSIVAAGSAAGISSGFNAAVSGCFFAVESVLWPSPSVSFSSLTNSTSMVILSSVIASIISEVGLGSDPTFTVPDYDFRSPSELPLYLLLGILCGLVSLALSRCTSFALKVADNLQNAIGLQKALFPALGGLTVGLIALAYPEVLYWGFQNVDILLESRPYVNGLPAGVLFQLVGVKIVATSISRASGLVGGYYAPSLFIGAATGMAYGKFVGSTFSGPNALFHLPILDVASPQAYGLVGMAATLAGVCQVPLTSVLLLFELTQDYRIVLPLLGAVGLSSWISSNQNGKRIHEDELDQVESSRYGLEGSLNNDKEFDYSQVTTELPRSGDLCELESSLCVYDRGTLMSDFAMRLTVAQAMRTRYITVQMSTTITEAIELMFTEKQLCAPVTDNSNLLLGQLSLEDIQEYSRLAQAYGKTEVDKIQISEIFQTKEKKYRVWTASPNMTLGNAEMIMDLHGLNQLPVVSQMVDGQNRGPLIGLLDRECIKVTCRALAIKELLSPSFVKRKHGY
ncbi:chloride channel protein CLC-e [Dendrobium catenatum]|nr:chloride channel protein CLC-e [Dendrobium catenatum]